MTRFAEMESAGFFKDFTSNVLFMFTQAILELSCSKPNIFTSRILLTFVFDTFPVVYAVLSLAVY